ncbi:surface lipoprotein assembly modifier [Taylorella equigenitalis]|uniref:surface lipoprotein assembly modifier n=1 Tax=Taylorella equigenitalis TaxID=29575 RepID=UPI00237E5274|nr:surface lipoprotein assembly modifier [Taylorella equigenitalis]WDU52118.1 DUF560 domain-containing protein [Taylorella equigenitalis]
MKPYVLSLMMVFASFNYAYAIDDHVYIPEHVEKKILENPLKEQQTTVEVTSKEIASNPDLIVRAMLYALINNNIDDIVFLYPYYEALPPEAKEPVVHSWASGVYGVYSNKVHEGISDLREVISQRPDIVQARIQLAMALYLDNQYIASKDQFQKLKGEGGENSGLVQLSDTFIERIENKSDFEFTINARYIVDDNLNQAPENPDLGGGWKAEPAKSDRGLGLSVNIAKRFVIADNFFADINLNSNGKFYKKYGRQNELNNRLSLAIGHSEAKWSLFTGPIFGLDLNGQNQEQKKLDKYSRSLGMSINGNYWLTKNIRSFAYVEHSRLYHTQRKHLNGRQSFASLGLSYFPNARHNIYLLADFLRYKAKFKDDSYVRKGLRLGLIKEWNGGLSTQLEASKHLKTFDGIGFFNKVQTNHDYELGVTIWHRNLHFAGLTPRINYTYHKTKSNVALYAYNKHNVYFSVSKSF